ncbi:MAG: sodium:solute symporter family transporter [Saprospiraceae bacterium]
MQGLQTLDWAVFIVYFFIVAGYGLWIYNRKKKAAADTKDYFLAEGSLTWWAIGASLIASNISAEQFIGMSGNGFTVGIAVAAYEWVAAIALIIVAVFFMPIYLKNHIYTMPQFLKQRYNSTVSLIMAIFWLFLYVLVNLTSILYLGAVAINNLAGGGHFHLIMIGLAVFALVITLGGMKVIGFTDVIQVLVLIIGGLATTYLALTLVSEKFGTGTNALAGFNHLLTKADDHFHMILAKPDANASQEYINKYLLLPGIAMYFAGQWIVNLNYWGCNQYIIQRALGADLKTARTGILFAGFLKLMMPVIVMLPGIAAYVLYQNGSLQTEMASGGHFSPDNAYSSILTFLPTGLKGLALAALTAAIVASLAGKVNSISTIFTLDLYKNHFDKNADEKKLVNIGRITIVLSMLFAIFLTWDDLLDIGGEGGFTFIQKYTGFISPGVFAMFLLGMFWKRTTGAAGVVGLLVGFVLSVFFNEFAPAVFGNETWIYTAFPNGKGGFEIPFLICMGLAFAFALAAMILVSLVGPKINEKAFDIDREMFRPDPRTTVLIVLTLLLLSVIYVRFW